MTRIGVYLAVFFFFSIRCSGQQKTIAPVTDSLHPKSFKDYIPDSIKSQKGLFAIYQVEGKYYFSIPDSLLSRDLLFVTRISGGSLLTGRDDAYPGDAITDLVIKFEKGPGNKLFMRKGLFTTYGGDSSAAMFKAVSRSNLSPIVASFTILAVSPDKSSYLFDPSDFIEGDNEIFSFNGFQKSHLSITTLEKDKSYISHIRDFAKNTEIELVKTFVKSADIFDFLTGKSSSINTDVSFRLNTSIVLLPDHPMQQRFFDNRVGYFAFAEMDFSENPQGVYQRKYINRWRLEPRLNEMNRYLKGELVDPQHPIIFYIDPATPKKWVPYLIEGINDWQSAFQKAGFKNAIFGKMPPTKAEDSTWSLFDARHSAIVYKPSAIENASGPSIVDPRTGEILESHINWYHNVMSLIHDWYLVQCAAVDPKARKMIFDDSLMGQLIRFVSSHEVGHALGLAHNFGASSTVPVDSLRSKSWIQAHGICPSIMDYARFNYVAQPEDSMNEEGLFPRIGDYDKWAIEWGYRLFPQFKSPEEEKGFINHWTIKKLKNPQLWWGPESSAWDPRIQTEDLGDDPIKAGAYGIRNLQRILPHLIEWTKTDNEGYENLNRLYLMLCNQYKTYLKHVFTNIAGLHETLKTTEENGPIYTPIPKVREKEAISFINTYLFQTPDWLADTMILARTGNTALGVIGEIQDYVLRSMFDPRKIFQKVSREQSNGPAQTYSLQAMLDDMRKDVWTELYTHKPIDIFRRNLQQKYIVNLVTDIYSREGMNTDVGIRLPISGSTWLQGSSDVLSTVRGHLIELQRDISKDLPFIKDLPTKNHLIFLKEAISHDLKEVTGVFRSKYS